MTGKIKNARIESTMLGYEDHGIPTCGLTLDYGGAAQSFGGYDLRVWGIRFIMETLDAVGASEWNDLTGMNCRVRADHGRVYAIGHIVEDHWFDPSSAEEQAKNTP